MESDHLCTCNSQRTAGIDADRTLDGVREKAELLSFLRSMALSVESSAVAE
jgi:hypothetical protein